VIRIAAVGDLHCHGDCQGRYRRWYGKLDKRADLLVIAGDFTGFGSLREARDLAEDLADLQIPIVGVLGNHDWHGGQAEELIDLFANYRITILDGQPLRLQVRGQSLGIVGAKGFGGGFGRGLLTPFGEPLLKAWAAEASAEASKIENGLRDLDTDYRLVVLHYAPIAETLHGEPPEIYSFLGCSRLVEPIDRHGADLVLHGHAHRGREKGQTSTGIPVRNVALQVLQRYYALYELRSLAVDQPSHSPPSPDREVAPPAR
jgi:Icc-related predicted phosphoesterase